MGGWVWFTRRQPTRLLAVLLLVLIFFAYPWPANGTQTYPAYESQLASVSPSNSTSVRFETNNQSILVSSPPTTAGTVRVDLVRTHYSFSFTSEMVVKSQSGFVDNDWRPVSAYAPLPSGATAFAIIFQGANSSSQLAEVNVTGNNDSSRVLYAQNFSQSTSGWHLIGTAAFGAFGSPSRTALGIVNLGPLSGEAITSAPVPLPAGVTNVTVSGLIRFEGRAGPFDLALDILAADGSHIEYVTDWSAWTQYLFPVAPLSLMLWTAGLPYATNLVFEANNSLGGELAVQVTDVGQTTFTDPLLAYRVGQAISLVVNRSETESFTITVGVSNGVGATWFSSDEGSVPGVRALAQSEYFTLSFAAVAPLGIGALAIVENASYTFLGSAGFYPLASTGTAALASLGLVIASLVLLAPEWGPWLRTVARKVGAIRWSRLVTSGRAWLARHALALGLVAGAAVIYAIIALSFGGQPYDTWSFTVWNSAGQFGSVRGVYIQTQFVGDAVVRGGTIPWSSVGFAYGPLTGYLFAGMSVLVPNLSDYPSAAALYGAFAVQAQIKWMLGLFTLAAGLCLYFAVERATGRRNLATIAMVLLVFNPAIGFDSVVWGETDSILYFLFVLFAVTAFYRPTLALAVAACAIAVKETGVILLFPAALLVLGPRIPTAERLRRVAAGGATMLFVTAPLLIWGLLPSSFLSPFLTVFDVFIAGGSVAQPVVTPETYTVWTLFTGLTGGTGLTRLLTPSSTILVAGASFALLGTVGFALAWVGLFFLTRRGSTSAPLSFWLATTAFGAITFTAVLTGTGSRYYTLALPGMAGVIVLAWGWGKPWIRGAAVACYALVTALAFWTMYGVFTVIMQSDVPDLRGLSPTYNPVSRFIAVWYPNNAVITAGSVGAIVALVLAGMVLIELAGVGGGLRRRALAWYHRQRDPAHRKTSRDAPGDVTPAPRDPAPG